MVFSHLLRVAAYLVSILLYLTSAQAESSLFNTCSGNNYTSNSLYSKNLNTLLSSMSSNNDINYGFYNFSEGQGTDKVNAIALCRGDVIGKAACQDCVKVATTELPQLCPNRYEGIVWYDNCMLRYSNKSIFQSWEQPAFVMWNSNNVSDDMNLFSGRLDGLLSKLKREASAGDAHIKFATGNTNYTNFNSIYGLGQCTPDLTEVQCGSCLDASFAQIADSVHGRQGGRVVGASCNFRYESYPFYEIPSPSPSPTLSPPSSSPPPTSSPNEAPQTGGSNKVGTLLLLLSRLFSYWLFAYLCFSD